MNEIEEKIIKHHVKGLTILNFEERQKLVLKLMEKKPLKQIAKADTDLYTFLGWKTGLRM